MKVGWILYCWQWWIRIDVSLEEKSWLFSSLYSFLSCTQNCTLYILIQNGFNVSVGEKCTSMWLCLHACNFVQALFSPTATLHALCTSIYGVQFGGMGNKITIFNLLVWCFSACIWWRKEFTFMCVVCCLCKYSVKNAAISIYPPTPSFPFREVNG